MPRPGPPRMPLAVRLSTEQTDALHKEGRHLVKSKQVEDTEYLHEDGSVNISQVIRYHLAKSIAGFPK